MSYFSRQSVKLEAYREDECIGRLRYHWISPYTIHVTSLVTKHPRAIWILKQQLYQLPFKQIMFHRRKLMHQVRQPWRFHWRRLAHVVL